MNIGSYGLPYAVALDESDVMLVYYAGHDRLTDVHYARLSL